MQSCFLYFLGDQTAQKRRGAAQLKKEQTLRKHAEAELEQLKPGLANFHLDQFDNTAGISKYFSIFVSENESDS